MRAARRRITAALALAAGLALGPAVASASSSLQEATRAAGGGQDTPGAPATPDSVIVPDSAVVTGTRLDDMTARVASELRCPVCRNQSVLESSSTLAREMQAEIKRRLARGDSPEDVKAYFVSRYGEWVLLQPRAEGINLVVYLFPALAVLGGALLAWHLVRRWTREDEDEKGEASDRGEVRSDGLTEQEEHRLSSVLEEEAGPTA